MRPIFLDRVFVRSCRRTQMGLARGTRGYGGLVPVNCRSVKGTRSSRTPVWSGMLLPLAMVEDAGRDAVLLAEGEQAAAIDEV
jgi:hypothetical protein